MKDPLERLTWVRDKVGLNSKSFAESIGMTATALHNMYTRDSRVTPVLANSVELVHGIRAKWLLTGEGLRKTDYRTKLDASEQALLECIEPSKRGKIHLGEFVLKELEDEIERESVDYGRWLNRISSSDKNMRAEWSKYEKLRNRKEKLRSELWSVLNNLREGDLKQIIVDPLLLAIHFKERWEEVRERSADYEQMQSFGLQPDFDEAYLTVKKITRKMKGLFKLTNEQRKHLSE